jgi:hypothetical protein
MLRVSLVLVIPVLTGLAIFWGSRAMQLSG